MNWHALGQQKQIELCVLLSRRNVATSSGMWTLLNHKGRDQGFCFLTAAQLHLFHPWC